MSILDNELIQKYFGCTSLTRTPHVCRQIAAERVLLAMEQPITKGIRYLSISLLPDSQPAIAEIRCGEYSLECFGFHPRALRLPEEFQEKPAETEMQKKIKELSDCCKTFVEYLQGIK